jgi:predicted aconitase
MQLSKEEEKILNGEYGITQQEALKFLIRYGEALGAERLIDVQSVHTALAAPAELVRLIKGNYALLNQVLLGSKKPLNLENMKVFTTTHVCTIEPYHYKEFGITEEIMEANREIRNHYGKKGIIFTSTCTPYLVGNIPVKGNHIAWMESSAVVYANSIIGAMGNIEGIESTIAAGLTGKIPYAGFHVPMNRKAKVIFQVEAKLMQRTDFDALGYFIGEDLENIGMGLEVPILSGINPMKATQDALKGMGAAMATSGAVQLYHIDGVTPEACAGMEKILADPKKTERIRVTDKDIEDTYKKLCTATDSKVNLVILGCPHYSLNQIKDIALYLEGKQINPDVKLWIFIPAGLKDLAMTLGFGKTIEKAGGILLVDTCPALLRFKPEDVSVIASDSAKQIHYYSAEMPEVSAWFGTTVDCINAAITGKWSVY